MDKVIEIQDLNFRVHQNGRSEELFSLPEYIIKRNGSRQPFDAGRIKGAMEKCFQSIGEGPKSDLDILKNQIVNVVAAKFQVPTVEQVQDIVEMVLQAAGEYAAAKPTFYIAHPMLKFAEVLQFLSKFSRPLISLTLIFPPNFRNFNFMTNIAALTTTRGVGKLGGDSTAGDRLSQGTERKQALRLGLPTASGRAFWR